AVFMARLRQAVVRAKQGRVDESLAVLDSAQPMEEREEIMLALTRSQILREQGRLPEAVRALQNGVAALPDSTELRYDLAMMLEQLDRLPEMEQQLRHIISIDPNYAHAYNALGYTLADRNTRLDEAASLIERALLLQPNDPSIIDSMGWVKYRQGDYKSAIEHLRRSWELRQEAEVGVHLGEVLWVDGNQAEALRIWEAVQEIDHSNELLGKTRGRLEVAP